MALLHEGPRRRAAEPVRGAGDENTTHDTFLSGPFESGPGLGQPPEGLVRESNLQPTQTADELLRHAWPEDRGCSIRQGWMQPSTNGRSPAWPFREPCDGTKTTDRARRRG